jgi:hypothetical protein
MTIWSILRPLEIFYGHVVYFVVIWYIFPRFGIFDWGKSGNPGLSVMPKDGMGNFPWSENENKNETVKKWSCEKNEANLKMSDNSYTHSNNIFTAKFIKHELTSNCTEIL